MQNNIYIYIAIMVIVTTLITPILLKLVMNDKKEESHLKPGTFRIEGHANA